MREEVGNKNAQESRKRKEKYSRTRERRRKKSTAKPCTRTCTSILFNRRVLTKKATKINYIFLHFKVILKSEFYQFQLNQAVQGNFG